MELVFTLTVHADGDVDETNAHCAFVANVESILSMLEAHDIAVTCTANEAEAHATTEIIEGGAA